MKSSLKNMFLSLTLICIVAAIALAGVNQLTEGPIRESKKKQLENAIREVVPGFDNNPGEEAFWAKVGTNDSLKIYPAKWDGQLVGAAVETCSMDGFSGEIKLIVGFDAQGNIINYAVLQHAETPGLGDKMDPWFKTDIKRQNILGKDLSAGALKVSKDGGEVDAITAATITSRAFLDAINRAYAALSGTAKADGASGATSAESDSTSGATTSADETSGATTKN